jgi:hypothetical protein
MYGNHTQFPDRLPLSPLGKEVKLKTLRRHQILKVDDVLMLRKEDGTRVLALTQCHLPSAIWVPMRIGDC